MYTSSSNHSSQFRKMAFMRKGAGTVGAKRRRRRKSFFFFFPLPLQLVMLITWRVSHLIKLVHAVQSLKRRRRRGRQKKKIALKSRRESGQIIKYKLISVFESVFGSNELRFGKLKRYGPFPHSVLCEYYFNL